MDVTNPTIGSDVEFFVGTPSGIVSAEGLIPGTKGDPYRYDPKNPMWATQLDNVLAEGNIPPATTCQEFVDNIFALRQQLDMMLPQDHKTVAIAAHRMARRYMTDHAKVFGCDPSWDAWSLDMVIPKPDPSSTLRSAGFHIHIGYEELSEDTNIALARAMDLFLGVPGILVEPASERRAVGYGQAGNFRHQPHGVEYRTLSSYFASTRELVAWVYEQTQRAVAFVRDDRGYEDLVAMGSAVVRTINTEDRKTARDIVDLYAMPLPTVRYA